MIDDVHEFGDAARELLEIILTADGLGAPGHPVPVVLAFSGSTVAGESATAAQAITTFFEKGRMHAHRVHLRAFRSPIEDRLAYRQFLLHWETPLVLADLDADDDHVERIFTVLRNLVRGVPSRLERSSTNPDVMATVEALRTLGHLREARDEDALLEIRGGP